MGRKPSAPKLAEKSQKHESTNTYVEPESNNPSLEKVEVQPESTNPIPEPQQENSSKASSRKKGKKTYAKVRRSERLQNAVMNTENQDIERIIEEITVSESDKEDDLVEEELPEAALNEKNDLHVKVDYIIQLLEAQQKTMDALNSTVIGKTFFSESSGAGDVTYKGLYIDSQKKVEALTEENHQLNRKLEHALGKIEAYEKGNHMASEVLEKLKDVLRDAFWFSNMARAPEATVERCIECKTSTKRKRPEKETDKN